ncbi:unnamed protein product, partial [Amoebophrya sp. A25]
CLLSITRPQPFPLLLSLDDYLLLVFLTSASCSHDCLSLFIMFIVIIFIEVAFHALPPIRRDRDRPEELLRVLSRDVSRLCATLFSTQADHLRLSANTRGRTWRRIPTYAESSYAYAGRGPQRIPRSKADRAEKLSSSRPKKSLYLIARVVYSTQGAWSSMECMERRALRGARSSP